MSNQPFLKIDLLKKRRNNDEEFQTYYKPGKLVFRKGFFIGISFLSLVLLMSGYTLLRQKIFEKEMSNLQVNVDKYDKLVAKINRDFRLFISTKKFNKDLALSVSGLKSGSAILSEISRIIPLYIELSGLTIKKSTITLEGKVPYGKGLSVINSFLLNIKESVFFNSDDTELKDVTITATGNDESLNKKFFVFEIDAGLNKEIKEINKTKLIDLGSFGLAKRIDILSKAGLLEWLLSNKIP